MKNNKTRLMVEMGVLTAIVVVLEVFARSIKFGAFSITLVLAPIVIGAALAGWKGGAWLGLVFGFMVLVTGDAALFWAINIPATILVCLLKGILAGAAAGAVYSLICRAHRADEALPQEQQKKPGGWNQLFAVICAAIVCPVVNTGVFLIGCWLFFMDKIRELSAASGYENAGMFLLFGIVGLNFLVELGINLALSTSIDRILNIIHKRFDHS